MATNGIISVEVNLQSVQDTLKRFNETIDRERILDEMASILLNRIRTRFLSEVDPSGSAWIPSKAGEKRRAAGGTGTLFDSGRLFRSVQLAGTGPDERQIMTDVPYAAKHNFGEDGMIKREFMNYNSDDLEVMSKLLAKRVEEALS